MDNKPKDNWHLTVAELVLLLQQMPQDLPVRMEGCDCYQNPQSCKVMEPSSQFEKGSVLITNTDTREVKNV